jgi:hypothetical protein
MTTITPMIRVRGNVIFGLATNDHTGQQPEMVIRAVNSSRRFVMQTDQTLVPAGEGSVSDAKGQVPLQTSAEFVRTYNAQAHEIVDAITGAVTNAEAGLNWLSAEPPDLEGVRLALNGIASDGKRVAELVVRFRALMNKVVHSGSLS